MLKGNTSFDHMDLKYPYVPIVTVYISNFDTKISRSPF